MTLRRRLVALTASAMLLTACGVDAGVETISATRTGGDNGDVAGGGPDDTTATTVPGETAPDATSTPTTPPDTGEPPTGTEAAPTTSAPTEPTLPPIIEPELTVAVPLDEVIDTGNDKPVRAHDEFLAVAVADIERWWEEVFPEVYGERFVPLEGGIYAGYPGRDSPIPGCGEESTDYGDLQLFVAFYCELGDFMAYDDGDTEASLLTPLAQEYGPAVMGVVMAHEYAHAIQERIGALELRLATIITEQQADCFAGAWTGQAYRGESPLLRLGDRDVRAGLLAMLEVRDPVGTNQFVPGGHGSAFDRVGAFQEGFVDGPARCAELLDEPLPLMPNEFQSLQDLEREGNAPYDCSGESDPDCVPAPEFLADDLDHFWETVLGTGFDGVEAVPVASLATIECDGAVRLADPVVLCPADRRIVFDEPEVRELYDEFGDFTIGYFYGIGWAEFAQREVETGLTGEERALLRDCYTGAWVRDITPDEFGQTPRGGVDRDGDGQLDGVVTSPGDLDEAIQMAILVGDQGANVDVVGSPFEKIGAFRTGVLGGLDACDALHDG